MMIELLKMKILMKLVIMSHNLIGVEIKRALIMLDNQFSEYYK